MDQLVIVENNKAYAETIAEYFRLRDLDVEWVDSSNRRPEFVVSLVLAEHPDVCLVDLRSEDTDEKNEHGLACIKLLEGRGVTCVLMSSAAKPLHYQGRFVSKLVGLREMYNVVSGCLA